MHCGATTTRRRAAGSEEPPLNTGREARTGSNAPHSGPARTEHRTGPGCHAVLPSRRRLRLGDATTDTEFYLGTQGEGVVQDQLGSGHRFGP